MKDKYIVKVDSNFHYMDEGEQYTAGSYNTLEDAIRECEKITIESLKSFYEKDIEPDKLHSQWLLFGDDPFIIPPDGSKTKIPFSARSFVTSKLCKKIIKEK